MNGLAASAQGLWALSDLGAARRFAVGLKYPEITQWRCLEDQLRRDRNSEFGREHEFARIKNYADFAKQVPVRDWAETEPWINRIREGEINVLTTGLVTHLAPTSGSVGARKLIPFTADLQRGFTEGIGAWMTDLRRTRPGILAGPAHWAISPLGGTEDEERSAVRIGFADDAEYLGKGQAWLVRRAMAVPAELRLEQDMGAFWQRTLGYLLRERDLRLISVWHPTFMELLLEAAEQNWELLCEGIERAERRGELRRLGPKGWAHWWPKLQVISCWGDQAATGGWRALRAKFPRILVQAKGLLATEAVITLPIRGTYPLAVTSHFFEFLDEWGGLRRGHELEQGGKYEIVVTNGGGLWRYRLGDVVECVGQLANTPILKFLGRKGNVSDLCGEKLSEQFVAEVFGRIWRNGHGRPTAVWLRAKSETSSLSGYDLVSSTGLSAEVVTAIETELAKNPHYALARKLGQLRELNPIVQPPGHREIEIPGKRMGDVKPRVLESRGKE